MAKTTADIRSLARAHTETGIRVLAGIMQQPDAPPAARVAAVKELMDRGWGKAVQHVDVMNRTAKDMTDEEILARIEELRGTNPLAGETSAQLDPTKLN